MTAENYTRLEDTTGWLNELAAGTEKIMREHAKALRPTAAVLWDCMYLISRCIREPLYRPGGLTDPTERVKVSLLTHAFHLFLTSWDAALQGRFSAAANNARGISEAPAYLLAIHYDSGFAREWMNLGAKPSVWEARSAAAKAMNKIRRGMGSRWRIDQETFHRQVQPYSHMKGTAAVASLSSKPGQVKVGFGGVIDDVKLRAFTGLLANAALALLAACGTAMLDMLIDQQDWDIKATKVLAEGPAFVEESLDELKAPGKTEGTPPRGARRANAGE